MRPAASSKPKYASKARADLQLYSSGFYTLLSVCLLAFSTAVFAESSNRSLLEDYLVKYLEPEAAADYEFYLDDMDNAPYSDLRQSDALAVLAMYEADGFLQEWVIDRDSRRIVVATLAWFSLEQTAGGASEMEVAIKRLHRIAPETTKEAIAYAASIYDSIGTNLLYTPWQVAVNAVDEYSVEYTPWSRSAELENPNNTTLLASNLK